MKRLISATALLVTFSVMALGCRGESAEHVDTAPQVDGDIVRFNSEHTPPTLKTAMVAADQESSLQMTGRIVWDEDHTVRVFSPFAGRIAKIAVQLGDRVGINQVLALLDSPDYGAAQADYRKALAARNLAVLNLQRSRDLYDHGVIAEKELEQAQSDAVSADAEAERTERVLKQFADDGGSINQRLALRSPIDGVVVERSINPGQQIGADQSGAPLFVVTNPGAVWVSLDARENELATIKIGDSFSFRTGATDETFTGTVLRVADYVDPNSRTIKILAKAQNTDRRLKGEMFVTATFATERSIEPRVPSAAVFLVGEQHYAFVHDGDAFVRREVRVGREYNGQVAITSGVKPGEQVVAEGALYLQQLLQSHPRS